MCSQREPLDHALAQFGIGVAFLALAASGQQAFLGVGLAFVGLGVGVLVRSRRGG